MTDWTEHPDLYYRREGRTVEIAGRDVVEGNPLPPRITYDTAAGEYIGENVGDPRRGIDEVAAAWTAPFTTEGNRPVIHVSAEAAAPSKRLTLAELAAFVEQARAAGVPDTAGLNVTTKGIGHLRKIRTEDGSSE